MTQFVYAFDHKHPRPPMEMKDLLGGKGANLAEMTSVLRLPVPPGFTISTEACRTEIPDLDGEVEKALAKLEKTMGKRLGDSEDPLLVSVRSGAKFSMPGMMDTVLNLGLNDDSVKALAMLTNDQRFALDSYRRFISMFGRIVLDVPGELFDERFESAKELSGAASDSVIPVELLDYVVAAFKDVVRNHTGEGFPQDPQVQLKLAIEAVFRSWNGKRAHTYREQENIPHDLGTAVNVQAMVFGNRDDNSGTGVGFTRDPSTGAQGAFGDFLLNAQGEDVVAGIRTTEPLPALERRFPEIYKELMGIFARLERHYRDMCDTEFTIEQGKLWMLQTRTGKRTGTAAMRMAVDMTKDRHIKLTKSEAVCRITPAHLDQVLHPQFAHPVSALTKGLAASPGAAVGKVAMSAQRAIEWRAEGHKVVLVRTETSPEDIAGMLASEGILTARGGLVSHAAVVARGWGKPAVVGAESVRVRAGRFEVTDSSNVVVVEEGDLISINGTTGEVVLGEVELALSQPPPELEVILGWADEICNGRLAVRANADNGPDAVVARNFGAVGIGLCRTEHMFLIEDRLPIVRRMILSQSPEEEQEALEELGRVQQKDFLEILEAMDGLPVTVRLLDPPLHEFLPHTTDLKIKAETEGLDAQEQKLLQAAEAWQEVNPMLGVRGVRLGVVKSGLYEMQVKALVRAALERASLGGCPIVEVMIPLTVSREELSLARAWVTSAIEDVVIEDAQSRRSRKPKSRPALDITIGTMIETPRAALRADQLAEAADFFSFGTNDLTQMVFGFSRDDVEGRMMSDYLERGLLAANPFETIDIEGVGALINSAVSDARQADPAFKIGVCGEHGGDPASIEFFVGRGFNYVSCSPFRVPIARLAGARAILRTRGE